MVQESKACEACHDPTIGEWFADGPLVTPLASREAVQVSSHGYVLNSIVGFFRATDFSSAIKLFKFIDARDSTQRYGADHVRYPRRNPGVQLAISGG